VTRRSRIRALGFALALTIALGVGAVAAAGQGSSVQLPVEPPEALVASALRAAGSQRAVSGTVTTHVDLGLPELPDVGTSGSGDAAALLGDQRFKIWSSPDGLRVAQLLPFSERVFLAGPGGLWTWSSDTGVAVHTAVDPSLRREASKELSHVMGDPAALAARLLDEASPYARVSVAEPQEVAGRDAYVLRLTPTSPASKVGHIDASIDAATRVPLRVQVYARSATSPSIDVGFSSVSFAPIDAGMFAFSPPPGSRVREASWPSDPKLGAGGAPETDRRARVFGSGFGTVVAIPVAGPPEDLRRLLPFEGPLGSAQLLDRPDGSWIVAGAVDAGTLAETASKLP
jgi:hypothetical protein